MPFPAGSMNVQPVADTSQPAPNVATGLAPSPAANAPVMSSTASQTFGNVMTYGIPLLGVGLADTLGQSVGILKDHTVPDFMRAYMGGPNSIGETYAQNQQSFRTGGEIAAFAVPGLAGIKLLRTVNGLREAGSVGAWAKGSVALDVLLGNSAELTAAEGKVTTATKAAAEDASVWAGRTVDTPGVKAAKLSYYGKRAADAVRTTAAFELGNRAAFNSSDTFYPADTTLWDQAKWTGLGFGVGIGLDAIAAKFVLRNIIQNALKDTKLSSTYDMAMHTGQDVDKVIVRPNERGLGMTYFAGVKSDLKATAALPGQSAQLQTHAAQDVTNADAFLIKQLELGAYDTHLFVPRTTLEHNPKTAAGVASSQINLGLKALDTNPSSFLSMVKIGQIPKGGPAAFYENMHKVMGKIKDKTVFDTLLAKSPAEAQKIQDAGDAALKPLLDASTQMHYVVENTGNWSVYKNRADNFLDFKDFSDIARRAYKTPVEVNGKVSSMTNSKLQVKADNDLTLHDNFVAEIPKGATQMDYSALYAMGSRMIKEWKPVEGQVLPITRGLNWRTTEMTLALAEQNPAARSIVQLADFSDATDAKFHVLNQKFQEFQKLMPDTSRAGLSSLRARMTSAISNYTPAQVIQRLNLPEPPGLGTSPVVEMFAHAKLQGMTDLNEMFPAPKTTFGAMGDQPVSQWDLMQQHLRETAGIVDETEVPVSGNLLNQGTLVGERVVAPKPLFVAANGTPLMARADQMIAAQVRAKRDVQLERLANINPKEAPLVVGMIGKVVNAGRAGGELSGAANVARDVQSLHDGILSGTGQVVYQDRINEQFPTLKAMQLLAQDGDHFSSSYVQGLAKQTVTPRLAAILAPKNKNDLFDFNRIEQAYRHGWDIEKMVPATGGDGYMFQLKTDSAQNIALAKYHYPGTALQTADDGTEIGFGHMPGMSVTEKKGAYKPLVVSRAAGELANSISEMSKQSGRENNALRIALGKSPIQIRDFHLPTPELNKEGTYFVKNSADRVIATYYGPNLASNKRRAQEAAEVLNKNTSDPAHVALPLDLIKQQHQINDDQFFSLIDYSDQLAKSGAGIKGGLAHTEVDTTDQTARAMSLSLQEQYLSTAIRARAAIFEPELNYARQASAAAAANGANKNLGGINIFDRYISTAFSQSPNISKGAIGQAYTGIESTVDKFLSFANAHYTEITGSENNANAAKVMRKLLLKQSSAEEFEQFKKVLPSYSPFEEASQWAESTFREKPVWASRPIAAQLAKVSSTLSLRFLDVGTAINNFAGLVTNTPSLMYALRKGANETHDQWVGRTAAWGTQLAEGSVSFSPMKAMNTAIKAVWSGELNGPMADAARQGYFEPEYMSLTRALSTPQKPGMAALENFVTNASKLADKSEIISRQITWGMGYKIGKDLHGFTDEKNAYIFANNFVNDMIGNYSPNNKPAMFQGMLGLPIGAFQTYMFNAGRRMFGMVERQDKAALMAQYFAQSAVFGAKSVPGYRLWNSMFQSNQQGSDDFTSRVERNLGAGVGELLLNGSLSNIPKIFAVPTQGAGAIHSDNGLAFYSRGSMDFQSVPTMLDMSKAPSMQFLANTYKGITKTIDNVFSSSGFSMQQQEEILAQFSTNRAMKSIMEMASGVKKTQQGAVIDGATRDAIHVAAGLLGTQTSKDRSVQEAMQRDRQIQLTQEDLRASLTDHTQAIFHSGGEITVPELQGIVGDYLKSGGDRRYLGQWFRNNIQNASEPAVQRRLETLGRSGKLLEFEDMLATLQQNQNPNTKGK